MKEIRNFNSFSEKPIMNEAFDKNVEQKRVQNFIKKVVREIPEFKEQWEAIMNADEESHDDYGGLELIQRLFKDYNTDSRGEPAIKFNSERRLWKFYIPIDLGRGGLDLSYEDRQDYAKIVKHMAEEYWPEAFEITTGCNSQYFTNTQLITVEVHIGNENSTTRKLMQTAVRKFLKNYRISQTVDITDHCDGESELPNKLYILENTTDSDRLRSFDTFSYYISKGSNPYLYAQFNGRSIKLNFDYEVKRKELDSDVILTEMKDYFFPGTRSE